MKPLLRLFLLAPLATGLLPAQDTLPQSPRSPVSYILLAPLEANRLIVAVRAADDERLAATIAGDAARLDAILSDELRYAHANGRVDTKDSYIKSLVSRNTVYESFDYQEINFHPASLDIVLMTGRAIVHASDAGRKLVIDLNFLAVWREENGRWRFLAWQSCRNPTPLPQ